MFDLTSKCHLQSSNSEKLKFQDGFNTRQCNETNPRYIGCYADDRYRDLDKVPWLDNSLQRFNISSCNNECQGYRYFSLQYGGQCFCGDAYATAPKYQKRPDEECGGVNGDGGFWRNSIYETCDNINES